MSFQAEQVILDFILNKNVISLVSAILFCEFDKSRVMDIFSAGKLDLIFAVSNNLLSSSLISLYGGQV